MTRHDRLSRPSRAGCEPPTDHPTIGPSTIPQRLWNRARKIAPHHLRFFSKNPKAILRHEEGEGRFLLAAPCVLLGGNAEVSALREFFAV
jgi:hypothetical protein